MTGVKCPNCGARHFYAIAHVTQQWLIDENGNFQDVFTDCIDVLHSPNAYDIWECAKCGHEFTPHEETKGVETK